MNPLNLVFEAVSNEKRGILLHCQNWPQLVDIPINFIEPPLRSYPLLQ